MTHKRRLSENYVVCQFDSCDEILICHEFPSALMAQAKSIRVGNPHLPTFVFIRSESVSHRHSAIVVALLRRNQMFLTSRDSNFKN